jgi:hypothetical protein
MEEETNSILLWWLCRKLNIFQCNYLLWNPIASNSFPI